MRNFPKQKYLPCEVKIIMFYVEQGFATSATAGINEANQLILTQQKQNGHVQNEQYNQQKDWFDFGQNQ